MGAGPQLIRAADAAAGFLGEWQGEAPGGGARHVRAGPGLGGPRARRAEAGLPRCGRGLGGSKLGG